MPTLQDRFCPTRTPFTKAARTLHDALDRALKYTEQLEPDFHYETALIAPYMDDATRTRLCSLKLDFLPNSSNNIPTESTSTTTNNTAKPTPTTPFSTHAARVLTAMEIWRNTEQPTARDWEDLRERGSISSVEDVRLAWRKVKVSCRAIGGLFEWVRGE